MTASRKLLYANRRTDSTRNPLSKGSRSNRGRRISSAAVPVEKAATTGIERSMEQYRAQIDTHMDTRGAPRSAAQEAVC